MHVNITVSIPEERMQKTPNRKIEDTNEKKRKRRSVAPKSTTKSNTKKARSLVYQYSLDPYDYSDEELINMSVEMFNHFQLIEKFYLTEDHLIAFMTDVAKLYNPENYFHNFKHAWGVMHMSFQILLFGASQCLGDFDILAIMLSAVCHDVGHPGNNNAFEIATKTEVSQKYKQPNEVCVLERYHSALTKTLLVSDSNLLHHISSETKDQLLEAIHYIIMGTDMGKHSSLVEEAQEYARRFRSIVVAEEVEEKAPLLSSETLLPNGKGLQCQSDESGCTTAPCTPSHYNTRRASKLSLSPMKNGHHSDATICSSENSSHMTTTPSTNTSSSRTTTNNNNHNMTRKEERLHKMFYDHETRMAFARIITHTADIGAQTQALPIALKWVDRCYNEFRLQADKESALGIITSPFMHDLKEESKMFKSQYFFITDIVEPIWKAVSELLPDLTFACEQLVTNKAHYRTYYE